jgi:hypothetical protein
MSKRVTKNLHEFAFYVVSGDLCFHRGTFVAMNKKEAIGFAMRNRLGLTDETWTIAQRLTNGFKVVGTVKASRRLS